MNTANKKASAAGKAGSVKRKGIVGHGSAKATKQGNTVAQKPNPGTGRKRAQNQKG